MARAWRIEYDGALYRVLSRGNERQDIFIDYDLYLYRKSVRISKTAKMDRDLLIYIG